MKKWNHVKETEKFVIIAEEDCEPKYYAVREDGSMLWVEDVLDSLSFDSCDEAIRELISEVIPQPVLQIDADGNEFVFMGGISGDVVMTMSATIRRIRILEDNINPVIRESIIEYKDKLSNILYGLP